MTLRSEDPEEFLPLKHREFLMLLSLAQGAAHGYALKQEIERRTEGRLQLGPGTLYRTVRALEDSALIAETPGDAADPRRRVYAITELGRAVLAAEATRLDALVHEVRAERIIP